MDLGRLLHDYFSFLIASSPVRNVAKNGSIIIPEEESSVKRSPQGKLSA